MIFHACAVRKKNIGKSFTALPLNRSFFHDYTGFDNVYVSIIRGFVVVEPREGETRCYFMSSHTPYIIWCETGAVNFLYMRLDLQNPSPCVGVNGLLSLDQAIDGVVERIKSEGTQTQEYPDYVDKDRFDNRMECEVRRRNRNRNRT